MELVTGRITTPEGVGGYLAYPKGQRSPAVLVHFEIFGINSHIEDVCRRFAEAGYAALAPDYYWRLEQKTAPYSDMSAAWAMAQTLQDEQIVSDAGSAIRYLREQDFVIPDAIASVGFCMGGRISMLVAARQAKLLSAAISFYGGGLAGGSRFPGQTMNPMEEATKIQAPVLLFWGAQDQHITPDHIAAFTGKLQQLGKTFQAKTYPDAGHAFFCNERAAYNPEAARDAWQKTLTFLEANLRAAETARN